MTVNPYANLADHQFWRAVAEVERFRFDPVVSTKFKIKPSERIASAGSCFAQHISGRLAESGFNYFVPESGDHLPAEQRKLLGYGVFSGRYGNIYTSRQLLQLFESCMDGRQAIDGVWLRDDGRYVDALRPQVNPAGHASPREVLDERSEHLSAARKVFTDSDVFVFTLGLTETWISKADGTSYPLAPGVAGGSYDPGRYEFHNLDVYEVSSDMETFLGRLKSVNPKVKVVLTVSPVPLIATYEKKNVLVSTTYSKSVLRVVADMLCRQMDWVEYFPSYEIITGNYSNSRYYADDYRNVNKIGVDHAMDCFMRHFTLAEDATPKPGRYRISGPETDLVCDEDAIDQVRV